jgi:hypothetical protein
VETITKVTLPPESTPQEVTCFAIVAASTLPNGLSPTGVDQAIANNTDYGGDTYVQTCNVQGHLTPVQIFSIPPVGSTDQPTLLTLPAAAAYDPTTGIVGFVLPYQIERAGSRFEVLAPDATSSKLQLVAYSAPDASGPAAAAGLSTDIVHADGSPWSEWTPKDDADFRDTFQRTVPVTTPVFPVTGSPFFSGSAGGTGRTDAAVDAIKLTDVVGYQTTQAPNQTTPWACMPTSSLLCGSDQPMPAGNVFVISADMAAPIPMDGPDFLQYQVGFDSDGIATNNLPPSTDFPNNPLQGTDVVYLAQSEPGHGWHLYASDNRHGQVINNKPTAAQAVIDGDRITFLHSGVRAGQPSTCVSLRDDDR